jgi:hypothetical protein
MADGAIAWATLIFAPMTALDGFQDEGEGEDADMFAKTLGGVAGRRLTYSDLTGKADSS